MRSQAKSPFSWPVLPSLLLTTLMHSTSLWAMSDVPSTPALPEGALHIAPAALANQCVSVQAYVNDQWRGVHVQPGVIFADAAATFVVSDEQIPSRFFLKAAGNGRFMLRDTEGRYLSRNASGTVRADDESRKAQHLWEITQDDQGYRLLSDLDQRPLTVDVREGDINLGHWTDLSIWRQDQWQLVAEADCQAFPEIALNARMPEGAQSPDASPLRGDVTQPVRGYIDAHAHITSYEFMGGKFMAGEPYHPYGVEEALQDSAHLHGKDGALDLIGNLYTYDDINHRYDTRGWPDFPWWPNHAQMSHMGYYYKWMERAHLSGLRIVVTNLVENEVLCWAQSNINPASWVNANSCNVMDSIRLQAQRLRELEEYIDAQAGGPGQGFFHIVTTPQEARETIAAGRLAVVMGIEASETFNCGLNDYCTRDTIEALLQEVYDLGVRSLYPTHKFDNQLAGSVVEGGFINVGELLSTGRFFETKECDEHTSGRRMTSGFPLIGDIDGIREILDAVHLNPEYDETIEHCNQHGLSPLGSYLVNRMIDLKMMVELDHMSNDTATAVMDIAEARGYSGVLSTHSWMLEGKHGSVHHNTRRLIDAGGFTAPYNSDANDMAHRVDRYLTLVAQTPYWRGVGIGTDMSGLGGQPGPREDVAERPLTYPFTSEFGITFDRQTSGHRVFDLNVDGIAHYGLLADFIEDLRQRAPAETYDAVMNSAEAYLQTWERAHRAGMTDHYDPPGLDHTL